MQKPVTIINYAERINCVLWIYCSERINCAERINCSNDDYENKKLSMC